MTDKEEKSLRGICQSMWAQDGTELLRFH